MKNQALFSSKDKVKNLDVVCCSFRFDTLRVKNNLHAWDSLLYSRGFQDENQGSSLLR